MLTWCQALSPNFNYVSILHVELSWRLALCYFGAIEVEADLSLGAYRHFGQILGEDGAQWCILKYKHITCGVSAPLLKQTLKNETNNTNPVQRKLLRRISVFALKSHSDVAAAAFIGFTSVLCCHDNTLWTKTTNQKKKGFQKKCHYGAVVECTQKDNALAPSRDAMTNCSSNNVQQESRQSRGAEGNICIRSISETRMN